MGIIQSESLRSKVIKLCVYNELFAKSFRHLSGKSKNNLFVLHLFIIRYNHKQVGLQTYFLSRSTLTTNPKYTVCVYSCIFDLQVHVSDEYWNGRLYIIFTHLLLYEVNFKDILCKIYWFPSAVKKRLNCLNWKIV